MTDKIVSLSQKRKEQARTARKQRADENAVKYGRTKAQKNSEELGITRARSHLDGHKQDPEQ